MSVVSQSLFTSLSENFPHGVGYNTIVMSDTIYSRPLIHVLGATVYRGNQIALNNVSLTISEGEHTAIIGPNGSGKSTLIKLITKQLYPLAGKDQHPVVEIFGRERWDVFELRSMLGILSNDLHQQFTSDDSVDVIEAVISGFFASKGVAQHQKVTSDMVAMAHASLKVAGGTSLIGRVLSQLSTGEARRVLIARALVSNPRAVILDEPTAGLDIVARRHFLHSIQQITRHDKTVLLVTHHVEEIIPEIKRVILIKNGRIFRDGSKDDILTSSILSELFDEPIELRRSGEFYSAEIESLPSDTRHRGGGYPPL